MRAMADFLRRHVLRGDAKTIRVVCGLGAAITCLVPLSIVVSNCVMDAPLFWWPNTEIASNTVLLVAAQDSCVRGRLLGGKASLQAGVSRWDLESSLSTKSMVSGKAWSVSDVQLLQYRCERDAQAMAHRDQQDARRAAELRSDDERAAEQMRALRRTQGSAVAAAPREPAL